ncbi:ABC transporter permease [Haloprofundus marisrubri]|uniref:ABC transporter permease n=1 Tax=Haloprofundus marisrubri TaxID=1514971 RepID=A0A0W1R6H2_9EURY|nr:ABC transporter permease [Haloprofundus marisrubri]KTG09021.1 ABC transporter permease [Haloprofundus marisrubri]
MSWLTRISGGTSVAIAQLKHERMRTVLAVVGLALAVLAATLLASVGTGVVATGQEKFDTSGRDLWITGGTARLTPGAGGVENPVMDSHKLQDTLEARDDIHTASPLAFKTVYVGNSTSEFETFVGVGGPARGKSVQITEGEAISQKDIHYANGTYEGPMLNEVVIDRQTANALNVSVGDTIYIGGTLASARQHEFTIVGISPTYSNFLGAPTVVVPLSELQEVTGTTGGDRSTMISVSLTEGNSPEQVASELEAEYPQYTIRTNQEQFEATLQRQAVVIASGLCLVALAFVAGIALTVNLLLSLVYQQRKQFAAFRALGGSTATLSTVVVAQALILGVLGGILGVALTIPAADLLNVLAAQLVGFEGLVQASDQVLIAGLVLAPVMSVLGSVTAVWRLSRMSPLTHLNA